MNSSLKSLIRAWLPRGIAQHRILAGPLRGQRIVTSWHDYPGAITGRTERPLLAWFANHVEPGQTWLDVGAHYGYTAIALSRLVRSHGRVFAFEPMVSTAGHLSQTRLLNQLPQLSVLPLALGSPPTLRVERLPAVRGMVHSMPGADLGWEETILVARLDWLWPQICETERRVNGVKIDVQGMEIQVLKGMAELLTEFKPKLVVELHSGVARSEMLELVAQLGYHPQGVPIEPVQGEVQPQYVDDRSYAFEAISG